jgi:hypothetical protein
VSHNLSSIAQRRTVRCRATQSFHSCAICRSDSLPAFEDVPGFGGKERFTPPEDEVCGAGSLHSLRPPEPEHDLSLLLIAASESHYVEIFPAVLSCSRWYISILKHIVSVLENPDRKILVFVLLWAHFSCGQGSGAQTESLPASLSVRTDRPRLTIRHHDLRFDGVPSQHRLAHRVDLIVVSAVWEAAHSSMDAGTHGAYCGGEDRCCRLLDQRADRRSPCHRAPSGLIGRRPGISCCNIWITADLLALSSISLALV